VSRGTPALLLLALSTGACAGPTTYYAWGSYSETLYAHYRAPQDREAWIAGLKATILEAEQDGKRMPPGVYAEYGYALFEEGDTRQAVTYFQKEQELWPEARFFMQKMIRNAEQRGRQPRPPTTGPAGALERS
jgi:hypothetical protein